PELAGGIRIAYHDNVQAEWNLGFVMGEVGGGVYSLFDCSGRDVLDVGAYFGETAVWFSKNGARRVIAVEPLSSFDFIAINAAENGCDNIIPRRACIAGTVGKVWVSAEENTGGSHVEDFAGNIGIRAETIESLATKFDLNDAILKMDVEGAEYDAILGTPRDVIRRFQFVMMEVHYFAGDPGQIYDYFVRNGFKIQVHPSGDGYSMLYADLG